MGRNSLMLTPDKIKEKSFQTTGRGSYRAEDVDSFLSEVSASYEQMFKENGDLIKKISLLAKKVEEYRADEESLKMALLNAQKLADKIVADAKETAEKENAEILEENVKLRESAQQSINETLENAKAEAEKTISNAKAQAEKILADANRQANDILGNINRKVTHESLVYEMVQKEAAEFKGKLVAMYKEHINLINQLPEIAEEKLNEAEKVEVVDETVEEPVVIEEETPVVVSEPEEVEEISNEEIVEAIDEEPEIEVEEVKEEIVEEAVEVVKEEPAPVKKPFKLDLNKIDFADDADFETESDTVEEVENYAEESDDDADDAPKSISFKNFFKKK